MVSPIILKINGKEREVTSDLDIGCHCPKHGAGGNVVHKTVYRDGLTDIFCWCGNSVAHVRNDKLYIREEA